MAYFRTSTLLTLLLVFFLFFPKSSLQGEREKALLDKLLREYNTLERPVRNESNALIISFGLTLMQIIDVKLAWRLPLSPATVMVKRNKQVFGVVGRRIPYGEYQDEKNQIIITNTWLSMDPVYTYAGLGQLHCADEQFDPTYQTNVVVRNNGSMTYITPGIFKSACKIDITWFPFDEQKCGMKFGSWTYDGGQLDLQLNTEQGGGISSFVPNGEWSLKGVPGRRNAIYYACCPDPYVDVTFTIVIQRRTMYYFTNLILPCILISVMAFLVFLLPPDSREKVTLGLTILLSLTVFLNMVAETMPATSDTVPLLATYFNCIMFTVASSVVCSIVVLNFHYRGPDTHEMSNVVRVVFLGWLPWLLIMSRPESKTTLKARSAVTTEMGDGFGSTTFDSAVRGLKPESSHEDRTPFAEKTGHELSGCGREISLIREEIGLITDKIRREDEVSNVRSDWKFVGMVMDRLCLIIFTLSFIIATIVFLNSAPYIYVP